MAGQPHCACSHRHLSLITVALMGDRRVSRLCWECNLLLTSPKGCQPSRYNLRSQSKKGIKCNSENTLKPLYTLHLHMKLCVCVHAYGHACNSTFVLWLLLTFISEDKHALELAQKHLVLRLFQIFMNNSM